MADRVNLGLLPSSEAGWPVACATLRPDTGGWLHVHGNVCSKPGSETIEHNPWEVIGSKERVVDRSKSGKREGPKPSSSVPIFKSESSEAITARVGSLDSQLEPRNRLSLVQPSPAEKVSVADKQDCQELDSRCSGKHSKRYREVWEQWAIYVAGRIRELLATENPLSCERHQQQWKVVVGHIEHVKSYAPHVDHIVVDIECRPAPKQPEKRSI